MKVSLRDVAAKAGVSATAASQALRGTGRLSTAVRTHIRTVATQMGYKVDPIISAGMSQMRLQSQKRFHATLAWLNIAPDYASVQNSPCFRLVWKGACRQASSLGYKIEQFWLHEPKMTFKRLTSIFKARGIEGVLLLQYYRNIDNAAPITDFDFSGFACASVTTRINLSDITFAQADHFSCTMLALRQMRALGYRRIGLSCPPSVDLLTQHRVLSAYHGFVSLQTDMPRLNIFADEENDDSTNLKAWLLTEKPQAVLGWKPPAEFEAMGIKVPQMLGVCMVDRMPELAECAGVDQNHEEIGAAAVRLVISQLQQGFRGVPSLSVATMLEGRWVPGSSLQEVPVN